MNKEIIITEYPLGEGAQGIKKTTKQKQIGITDQSSPDAKCLALIQANFDHGQSLRGHDFAKFHFYTQD